MLIQEQALESIRALGDDLRSAWEQYEANDSQFTRRAVVRTLFAFFEGTLFAIKDAILANPLSSNLPIHDLALLKEESYSVKDNGQPYTKPTSIRFVENFRYTTALYSRLLGKGDIKVDYSGSGWQALQTALKIRDRITHPKVNLDISDSEIKVIKEAHSWGQKTFLSFFRKALEREKAIALALEDRKKVAEENAVKARAERDASEKQSLKTEADLKAARHEAVEKIAMKIEEGRWNVRELLQEIVSGSKLAYALIGPPQRSDTPGQEEGT